MTIPTDPDVLLRRKATAAALTESGFPVATATLATMAVRGGGPPYQLFGRVPLYRWSDARDWAVGRLTPPCRSSSEADAHRATDHVDRQGDLESIRWREAACIPQ
jgi:hypothetical protein